MINPSGAVVRTAAVSLDWFWSPWPIASSGEALLIASPTFPTHSGPEQREQFLHVLRIEGDGTTGDTIETYSNGTKGTISALGTSLLGPLLQPAAISGGRAGVAFVGDAAEHRVESFAASGAKRFSSSWDGPSLAVSDSEAAAAMEYEVDRFPSEFGPKLRRANDERGVASSKAAYDRIVVDAAGRAWIRMGSRPWSTEPAQWLVLGPEGESEATIMLPQAFVPFVIEEGYLLGVQPNELGVEVVTRFPLIRPVT